MFTIKKDGFTQMISFILFLLMCTPLLADTLSVEVQENTAILIKTNQCVDCNLAGADLNRLNLSGADLSGADLSNASLFLADLSDANLTRSILRGAKFGGADLAGADLRGADLRGVVMSGAYLVGSKFDGSFAEVSVSDDETLSDVVEQTYIPDDSVPKQPLEKKQVNISDRRDFGPVPPQIDSTITKKTDGLQDGPVHKNAPPKKAVSPVSNIVIADESTADVKSSQVDVTKNKEETSDQIELLENDLKKEPVESVPSLTAQSKVKTAESPTQSMTEIDTESEMISSSQQIDTEGTTTPLPSDIKAVETKTNTVIAQPQEEIFTEKEVQTEQIIEREINPDSKDTKDLPGTQMTEADAIVSGPVSKDGETMTESVEQIAEPEARVPESAGENGESLSDEAGEQVPQPESPEAIAEAASTELLDLQKKIKKQRKCYECNLAGTDFSGANLDGADLEGTDFTGANLEKTDFEDANLKNVSFKNANLKQAKFNRADLYKANFNGADLTGAEFKKAIIDETNFENTVGYENLMIDQSQ